MDFVAQSLASGTVEDWEKQILSSLIIIIIIIIIALLEKKKTTTVENVRFEINN